ncbi:MAG: Uma2 family endonuclease [Gemmatimonadetes bacterium]|nr:Uma2 family endonuclease [Gemmatimonadota bacterium]
MATRPNVLSADDLLHLPAQEGSIGWEFVNGRPVAVMPAKPLHGKLIVEVARRLSNYVLEQRLGGEVFSDAGFVLGLKRDRERMRAPDVAYITREKAAPTTPSASSAASRTSPSRST